MIEIQKSVAEKMQRHKLFSKGDTILVGVSGGADSVSLLSILFQLRHQFAINLHVAHFNHNLRRTSSADEKFVRKMAASLSLPYHTDIWAHPQKTKKGSLEERARLKRFGFFKQVTKKIKADKVALAHNNDDLAETVLMHILRGTGLQGLRGILPQKEINDMVIIRPMLGVNRKEIEIYLKKNKIPFRVDPTNRSTQYFRNRIRHKLFPILQKDYNPNIKQILCNLSESISADYSYLEQQAQKLFKKAVKCLPSQKAVRISLSTLKRQPLALQRMLIRVCVEHIKGNRHTLTLKHLSEIEDLLNTRPTGSIVHFPQNICICKKTNHLEIYQE